MKQYFEEVAAMRKDLVPLLSNYVDKEAVENLFNRSLSELRKVGVQPTREEMVEAAGVDDFIRRLDQVKLSPILGSIAKHLNKLVEASSVSQLSSANLKGDDYNEKKDFSDKLFELYFASLILPFCQELVIDDPYNSASVKKKKNGKLEKSPDIIATIDDKLWAFECKVIESNTPNRIEAYLGLLDKALEQLSKVATIYNIPIFAFRQQTPLDKIWPLKEGKPSFWDDIVVPEAIHRETANQIKVDFESNIRQAGFIETLQKWNQGGLLSPATLNLLTATTAVKHGSNATPVTFKELQLWPFAQIDCEIKIMGQRIHDQLHFVIK
ncbi:MAG TPA: hypothetical protein VG537_00330 [Candidatus Kapabacteria bacterium]|jgi:hypothetical protein|nr:hypothetical protein [Candidatus Kapabacteria bacterium]